VTTPTRSPVTQLLAAVSGGDAGAQDRLWSLIYDELRLLAQHQMAAEAPGHTLQPTALVHEAYFRLFGENPVQWSNQGHFFTAAEEAMRRIRVDDAQLRELATGNPQIGQEWHQNLTPAWAGGGSL